MKLLNTPEGIQQALTNMQAIDPTIDGSDFHDASGNQNSQPQERITLGESLSGTVATMYSERFFVDSPDFELQTSSGQSGFGQSPFSGPSSPQELERARVVLTEQVQQQLTATPVAHRWTRQGLGGIDFNATQIELPNELTRALTAPEVRLTQLSPTDEVWIIAKSDGPRIQSPVDDQPGTGSLVATLDGSEEQIPVPLKHTEVSGAINGFIASVNVQQQFHNPYDGKIEAEYVFPLPDNAAVNGFLMTVGDRTIRGIIREKEEAQRIYRAARSQGYVASLLTQQRPNIFTQKVANIEPGKSIDIDISYFNTLAYADGWFEFVFPMVVGPRFNPPSSTDGIGVVARGEPAGNSGQSTEISYLRPNERSGHDIGITIDLEAGMPLEAIESITHTITLEEKTTSAVRVSLATESTIPNKDFVLRYRPEAGSVRSGLMVQPDADGEGGYLAAMLMPPVSFDDLKRSPIELVFVLDCSGSMSGRPMEQAKSAAHAALDRLLPGDSFQIIRFSESATQLGGRPLEATPENIARGKRYLDSLNSHGGTHMVEGIKAALDFEHDPERLRYVAFLTDGYIGNEAEILSAIDEKLGRARIFSFGVGSSVNRYLMTEMAKLGRGVCAFMETSDRSEPVMELFMDRLEHAALAEVSLDLPEGITVEAYPRRLPDLFVGRPVVTIARYEGSIDPAAWDGVTVRGRSGGANLALPIEDVVTLDHEAELDTLWARMKIASLDRSGIIATRESDKQELAQVTTDVALRHNLMSAYTSFVAVDSSRVTEGSHGTTVPVPVPVPEGVRYETTVTSSGK